jgi:2-polyprenyl-3-methyl-5-hydroxy-6-metoxy-1,4-benzoquinol methylase
MLFADPLREADEAYDADYYEQGHHLDNPHRRALFEQRYEEVLSRLEPPGRVLDVGCGTGDFLRVCKEHGWDTVGVDVSPFAAKVCGERTQGPAFAGRLQEQPLEAASFDVVHMHHVLEHVADPVGLLRYVRSLLRVGGHLVVEVPNERNLINLAMRLLGKPVLPSDRPPTHLLFFAPASLRRTIVDAGFQLRWMRQKDLATAARRDIYRYFDGRGNVMSRTLQWAYSQGIPSRLGQGVFLLALAQRPEEA